MAWSLNEERPGDVAWSLNVERLMHRFCLVLFGLTTVIHASAQAQANSLVVGATTASYQTDHPEGGIIGLGASVGVERVVNSRIALRGLATLTRGIRTVDDISICHRRPDGSCLPDSVFPLSMSSLELQAAIAPFRSVPIRLVAGGGVSVASEARESNRSAPKLPLSPRTQAMWRGGLELPLGASPRAPRLSLTRTGFAKSPFSLTHVDALTILLRP